MPKKVKAAEFQSLAATKPEERPLKRPLKPPIAAKLGEAANKAPR